MFEDDDRVIKRVFFIHANTEPRKINNITVNIVVDYVIAVGYVAMDSDDVYATRDLHVKYENYIPHTWWDTYEECEEHLAKILGCMYHSYSTTIAETFNRLKDRYPEYLI